MDDFKIESNLTNIYENYADKSKYCSEFENSFVKQLNNYTYIESSKVYQYNILVLAILEKVKEAVVSGQPHLTLEVLPLADKTYGVVLEVIKDNLRGFWAYAVYALGLEGVYVKNTQRSTQYSVILEGWNC